MKYKDPNDPFNGSQYHSKYKCDVRGCVNPAGTWWSPYWCFEHNVERMDRISKSLDAELVRYQ